MKGTVKFFNREKRFGFIDGEKGELFFHHSALVGTAIEALQEGQTV